MSASAAEALCVGELRDRDLGASESPRVEHSTWSKFTWYILGIEEWPRRRKRGSVTGLPFVHGMGMASQGETTGYGRNAGVRRVGRTTSRGKVWCGQPLEVKCGADNL